MQKRFAFLIAPVLLSAGIFYLVFAWRNAPAILADASGRVLGDFAVAGEEQAKAFLADPRTLPRAEEKLRAVKIKDEDLDIACPAGYILDAASGQALFGKNENERRPLASLTKLMTALVFLEGDPDWDEYYEIRKSELFGETSRFLLKGDRVKTRDLFNLVLVASDNAAAEALASHSKAGRKNFIAAMNRMAGALKMENTYFNDAAGLSRYSISTPKDIASLAEEAFSRPEIREASQKPNYRFSTLAGRTRTAAATDVLLKNYPRDGVNIAGGKTGFTNAAGYCYAGQFNKDGRELITVVMGGAKENSRFAETERMVRWAYGSHEWR